jgi:hypothetical protein
LDWAVFKWTRQQGAALAFFRRSQIEDARVLRAEVRDGRGCGDSCSW